MYFILKVLKSYSASKLKAGLCVCEIPSFVKKIFPFIEFFLNSKNILYKDNEDDGKSSSIEKDVYWG